ncbi:polycystin-1-like protein 2 [Branchiostoma lanceolatum]|uniref:polycystin-1-like protein 2 n=1 Tax=Branchiostoma lanceolatum TaxID=7740 RepID=UPI003454B8E4
MLKILKAYGIPDQLVEAIASMYQDTKAKVISPDGETELFDLYAGVLQGDTSSISGFTSKLEKQLDGCYTRLLRTTLNIHWTQHITNKDLYAGLPKLTDKIRTRRLKFDGHYLRSKEEVADLVLWIPKHEKRRPGRPAATFIDTLKKDTGLEVDTWPAISRRHVPGTCGLSTLPDGGPGECVASSSAPCCSVTNVCGMTDAHCACPGCLDYREVIDVNECTDDIALCGQGCANHLITGFHCYCLTGYTMNPDNRTCEGPGPTSSLGSFYLPITTGEAPWDVAQSDCRFHGGNVVSFSSLAEYTMVANIVGDGAVTWWIGLNDMAMEGTWLWLNGTWSGEPFPWQPSEPDGGTAENCAAVNGDDIVNFPLLVEYLDALPMIIIDEELIHSSDLISFVVGLSTGQNYTSDQVHPAVVSALRVFGRVDMDATSDVGKESWAGALESLSLILSLAVPSDNSTDKNTSLVLATRLLDFADGLLMVEAQPRHCPDQLVTMAVHCHEAAKYLGDTLSNIVHDMSMDRVEISSTSITITSLILDKNYTEKPITVDGGHVVFPVALLDMITDPPGFLYSIQEARDNNITVRNWTVAQITFYKENPFCWNFTDNNVVQTAVLDVMVKRMPGNHLLSFTSVPDDIELGLSQQVTALSLTPVSQDDIRQSGDMVYHVINGTNSSQPQALAITVIPTVPGTNLTLYLRYDDFPTRDVYNMTTFVVGSGSDFSFLLPNLNESSVLYLGVNRDRSSKQGGTGHNVSVRGLSCNFWSERSHVWREEGCHVSPSSTTKKTVCLCNHLIEDRTDFAASFFTLPNTIDFSTVFSADLGQNPGVFATVLAFLALFLIGAFFARRADKLDAMKAAVFPLPNNKPHDRLQYLLKVYTGHHVGSGTDSKVAFLLTGSLDDTDVRALGNEKDVLTTGECRTFLMTTFYDLGHLQTLHIWHDNSGKGNRDSWYLEKVVVHDLNNDLSYTFLCDDWLAVDRSDGLVYRTIPSASETELMSFGHLFISQTKRNFTDGHLWLSTVSKGISRNFTRVQRLGCCMSILFCTMIANAMWYQSEDRVESPSALTIGPISFTLHQLFVSVMSSLTVLPVNVAIVQIFRKTGNKPDGEQVFAEDLEKKSSKSRGGGEKMLPYWMVYVGWVLVFLSCFVSAFFTILYSLQWGPEKANDWLKSFFMSFFMSTLIIEPIKVILLAAALSMLCKKLVAAVETTDSSKTVPPVSEEHEAERSLAAREQCRMGLPKIDVSILKRAWESRQRRMIVSKTLAEIMSYLLYVVFILCVANVGFSSAGYHFHKSVSTTFDNKLFKVGKRSDVQQWLEETVVPGLFPEKARVRRSTTASGHIPNVDAHLFRLTVPHLRQQRMSSNGKDHMADWYPSSNATELSRFHVPSAWNVSKDHGKNFLPYVGKMGVYDDSGYFAQLGNTKDQAMGILSHLFNNNWTDSHTRAVFVEFALLSNNVKLVCVVTYLMEYTPTGGVFPSRWMSVFQLHDYVGAQGVLMAAVQLCFAAIVLIQTFREIKAAFRLRCEYFLQFWNVVEVFNLTFSWLAIAIGVTKVVISESTSFGAEERQSDSVHETLVQLASISALFTWVAAAVAFINVIKLIKLLRFNAIIASFSRCLRIMSKDLLTFMAIYFIAFLAFVQFGWLAFGTEHSNFKSFADSTESSFVMSLGNINSVVSLLRNNSMAPVYLLLFVVTMMFILLNLLISVINEALATMREVKLSREQADIAQGMWEMAWRITGRRRDVKGQNLLAFEGKAPAVELDDIVTDIEMKVEELYSEWKTMNEFLGDSAHKKENAIGKAKVKV